MCRKVDYESGCVNYQINELPVQARTVLLIADTHKPTELLYSR